LEGVGVAKLYFRYGAMGSSKTANAIMVRHNYLERNQKVLMLKPRLDRRDGARLAASRSGLECPCDYVEDLENLDVTKFDCVIVDEAQFMTKKQVEYLVHVVDDLNVPVIAYGLRADFRGNFFEGSLWLMAWADTIEEVKTICWCGKKATFNARIVDGKVAKTGEQIVLGGSESYTSLCRRHWKEGNLGGGAAEPDGAHNGEEVP
jgi:thymidine kinase